MPFCNSPLQKDLKHPLFLLFQEIIYLIICDMERIQQQNQWGFITTKDQVMEHVSASKHNFQ